MHDFELDWLVQDDRPDIPQHKHQMQHDLGKVLAFRVLPPSKNSPKEGLVTLHEPQSKGPLPCQSMQIFADSYAGQGADLVSKVGLTHMIMPVLYNIGMRRRKNGQMTRGRDQKTEADLLFELFSNKDFHSGCKGPCDYLELGLLWAARMGKKEVAKLLLREAGLMLDYKSQDGVTALHIATSHGYQTITEQLLKKGFSVDCQDLNNETPLHYAAENGDKGIVTLLLEYGADIHHLDLSGSSPLQKAVKSGAHDVVELLIYCGAKVNEPNNSGWTALHIAAVHGKLVHRILLSKGAEINPKDINGQTPLHKAVQRKEESIIKDLIEHGANINTQDNGGFSPLHIAADIGCENLVKLLVENGASIDLKNHDGYTSLRVASFNGNWATVTLLQEWSASSDPPHPPELASQAITRDKVSMGKTYQGSNNSQCPHVQSTQMITNNNINTTTPIFKLPEYILYSIARNYLRPEDISSLIRTNHYLSTLLTPIFFIKDIEAKSQHITFPWAAKKGNEPVFRLLLRKSTQSMDPYTLLRSEFPIHWAASAGDQRVIKYFIDINPDSVDLQNSCGDTALHLAARYGHTIIAQILIDKGADINKKNRFLKTPLHYAAKKGCVPLVEQLISKGANIEDSDYLGSKAIHKAAQGGSENTVKLLLDRGASINNHGNSGRTELHFAAQFGSDTMVSMLLQNGGDANSRDKYGDTPLHKAAERGDKTITGLLLDRKADLNIKNELGYVPLHKAVELGSVEVLTLLVQNKADINAQSYYGDTAMHLAVFNRDMEMMGLLLKMGAEKDISDIMGATPLDWVKSWALYNYGEAP